jgi:streptogramin lyase
MRPASALTLALLGLTSGAPEREVVEVCTANFGAHTVTCYDVEAGKPAALVVVAGAGGLRAPTGVTFGPDGHLYVSSAGSNQVLRYDGRTGAFMDVFVNDTALVQPFTLIFGPDGDLYVSSGARHMVLRFDGRSGELRGIAARDSLRTPIGLAFDAAGRLYVANAGLNNVSRFDPRTGARVDVFASDSLRFPSDIAIGAEGDVYVSSAFAHRIMRFDGRTGALRGVFGELPDGGVPVGIRFLPDGDLISSDFAKDKLYRFPAGGGAPKLVADVGLRGPENVVIRVR